VCRGDRRSAFPAAEELRIADGCGAVWHAERRGWNGGGPVADPGRRLPASCPGKSGVIRFAEVSKSSKRIAAQL
jgi:hypothetical protein